MKRYRVVHRVRYRLLERAAGAELTVMLRPRQLAHQRLLHHQLLAAPRARFDAATVDALGNHRQPLTIAAGARELELTAVSLVDLQFPAGPARDALALQHEARVRAVIAASGALSTRGSCQDRAIFALAQLRAAGHTARYVAGYRIATPAAVMQTQAHAWIAIQLDDVWLDFDPTTRELCREHVTVSWGHGYDDVAPLSGELLAAQGDRFRQQSSVAIEPLPIEAAGAENAAEPFDSSLRGSPALAFSKAALAIEERP